MPKFGTAITCIDGRVHEQVTCWLKQRYYLDYVDLVTEAGADAVMAAGREDIIERLRQNVERSVQRHDSSVIALVGHHDCAANPVPKEAHLESLRLGLQTIRRWNFAVTVLGLWVNEEWQPEEVA